MTNDEIQDVGVSVARQCTWDGDLIFKILCEALTDANHHTLRCRLEDAYSNYLEETT